MRDMIRVAQFHGIPFGPPRPDPIVQNVATREIAAEQPYIHRLTRLGQAASRRGKGLAFCDEVAQLIWGGARDWRSEEHTSELQSLMRISYAVFCLKKKHEQDARRAPPLRAVWRTIAQVQALPARTFSRSITSRTEMT